MSVTHHAAPSGGGQRYERVMELAKGGMAVLELAKTVGAHGFTKYVAMKRISPKWADDPEFIEMFLDEARLAAVLDHPNAVRVHDLGHDATGPYFVMDYIHGEDLLDILRAVRAPLPVEHVLAIGIGAASGLHHAHTRRNFEGKPLGLIHRDVSLSNILVTYEGGVKVVDFGIAKAMGGDGTRPSVRKGKVGYMSPEQCKSGTLDGRSDVFALGIVLWELLAGRRLFNDDNEFAAMNRIVNHDAPPLQEANPSVPDIVVEVVHRALERDPAARFSDARSMARALEDAADGLGMRPSADGLAAFMAETFGTRPFPWESADAQPTATTAQETDPTRIVTPVEPPAPPAPQRSRAPWLALTTVSVLLGGAGMWWFAKPPAPAPEPPPAVAPVNADPDPVPAPVPEPAIAKPEPDPDPEPAVAQPEPKPDPEPDPDPKPKPRKRPRKRPKSKPTANPPSDAPAFDPDGLGPVRSVLE